MVIFLIPDAEATFQDDDATRQGGKSVRTSLQERHISSVTWPANCPQNDLVKFMVDGDVCIKTEDAVSVSKTANKITCCGSKLGWKLGY